MPALTNTLSGISRSPRLSERTNHQLLASQQRFSLLAAKALIADGLDPIVPQAEASGTLTYRLQ